MFRQDLGAGGGKRRPGPLELRRPGNAVGRSPKGRRKGSPTPDRADGGCRRLLYRGREESREMTEEKGRKRRGKRQRLQDSSWQGARGLGPVSSFFASFVPPAGAGTRRCMMIYIQDSPQLRCMVCLDQMPFRVDRSLDSGPAKLHRHASRSVDRRWLRRHDLNS